MDEIGKLLPGLLSKQIRGAEPHLLDILLPLWPRAVGRAMAQHSRPALFACGVLTLDTDGATWAAQLRCLSEEIRTGVNACLGQPLVKKVRIRTVNQPDLFSPLPPARGTAASKPPRAEEMMNTAAIADREVAAALASAYAKYFNRPRS